MRAKPGIAAAALLAGCPVLPVAFGVRGRRIAGSWDSMLVVWPFMKGVYVIGEPIIPAPDESVEELRLRIEIAMNAVTGEADRLCDTPVIGPADDARA